MPRQAVVLDEYGSTIVVLSDGAARDLASAAAGRLRVGVGPSSGTWELTATQHVGTVVT